MNPRLIAAFFLMLFGACWITADLVIHNGKFDYGTGTGVAIMLAGAVFTDPKELVPAFKTFAETVAQFIPFTSARARRKSTQVEKIDG